VRAQGKNSTPAEGRKQETEGCGRDLRSGANYESRKKKKKREALAPEIMSQGLGGGGCVRGGVLPKRGSAVRNTVEEIDGRLNT